MKIKKATREDVLQSLRIAENLGEWFTKDAIKKMRRNFRGDMIVGYEKEVVGFLNYRINKKSIRILWVGVDRKYRRSGLGGKLLKNIENIARINGIKKIIVSTLSYEDNYEPYSSTRNFYLKNGFVYCRIRKAKKKGWDDEVIMEKII